ncbi:hypothetical protein [Roseibium polysiphoniae]|uniref:hypothetical protein n=1 Tax=Roseibium polysiphoniae TaxID=2571221 RepID=UPI001BCC252F|nr:hypothetical protein [Roseibium polysiphoniae]
MTVGILLGAWLFQRGGWSYSAAGVVGVALTSALDAYFGFTDLASEKIWEIVF